MSVGAAVATPVPTTLTGTSIPALPSGVSDLFNIFVSGTRVGGIQVTQAGEAACGNPVSILGGCSFSANALTVGGITISPKVSLSNKVAVFFEPNSTTISDIFLIGCESVRDTQTGLCSGAANWSVLTADPITGFIDYNALLSGLPTFGMSVGFVGTESATGGATAFPLGNYLTVTGNVGRLPIGANFVSSNDLPEPFTLSLFGAGLAGAIAMRRRRK